MTMLMENPVGLMDAPRNLMVAPTDLTLGPSADQGLDFKASSELYGSHGINVVLLMGRRGQGKTAFMTGVLRDRQQAYQRRRYDGHLFANYRVSFFREKPNGQPIDFYTPDLLSHIAEFPPWYHSGITAFDEIHNFAMSRRSMSKGNVNLSHFMTQIRHRDMEAIFTTQFPQVLDYQLLLQVDMFVRVEIMMRYPDGFPMYVALHLYDYWGQFTGRDYRKRWPPAPEDVDQIKYVFIPHEIAGAYNTREIISSNYWDPVTRLRVMTDENDDLKDWQLEASVEMRKAQQVHEVAPASRYRDLPDMINRMPKRFEVHLGRWIKLAQEIEGAWITGFDLVNVINTVPNWVAEVRMNPNGSPGFYANYIGEDKPT